MASQATTGSANAGIEVPKIAVIDVWKSFRNKEVLRGVNLEVRAGESFVIVGGSGAGKSVLLKHIIGLIQPDRATLSWTARTWPQRPPRSAWRCGASSACRFRKARSSTR